MASIRERLRQSWNVFTGKEVILPYNYGGGYSYRPGKKSFTGGNKQSIVSSVYNQIAVDAAAIKLLHAKVDINGMYSETIDDELNQALTVEANIDQTGRALIQDIVMSMMDEGVVAVVPVETDINPADGSYKIYSLRTAKVKEWYPAHVRVELLDDRDGRKKDILLPKRQVAIIENPLYAIMNEPNSTLQRLIRKINLLDYIDEQSSAGKLDLIIQLPYTIKTEARRKEAEKRRQDIERQLSGSKYGIAYTDGTEHITQLNRSVENNLLSQIQYLTTMLYSQLGLSEEIFKGTANESTMINYYNRTIEPILSAITDEMRRKFLTETARTQGQSITFFRNPFALVPTEKLADIADKFIRNAILSANEMRAIVGYKPIDDSRADELRNPNLNESPDMPSSPTTRPIEEQTEEQSDSMDFRNTPLSEI
ncbi:MAG: phage portal protein [Prevotellaceae bacterium]|nr:phage portal protein [Candidatus Faecinaster equi]